MKDKKKKPSYKAKAAKVKKDKKADDGFVAVNTKRHRDSQGNHHHGIIDEIDDSYVSVCFTTKKNKGKGSTNYTLDKDPFDSGKQSYMRRQGTVDLKQKYTDPKKGSMTEKDFKQAQIYAERAKQKYIDKKGKKSSDMPNTQRA